MQSINMKHLLQVLFIFCAGFLQAQESDFNYIERHLAPNLQVKGEAVNYSSVEARMAYHHVPGVSVAVVKDGKVAWSKGYGIANSETETFVGTSTLFQAGSISKPIAALAVLKLADQGKVDLDRDVNEYLTSWRVPSYEFDEKVTIRRLLTHTAGTTVHGFPGYKPTEQFPDDNMVLNGEGNTDKVIVDTEPGSNWRYSGGGYTIMEKVVEDVSGMAFQDYMRIEILDPIGMKLSTYEQPLPEDRWPEASAAYDAQGNLIEGSWHNYPEQAAAGLWTTPEELAIYITHIQGIVAGKSGILSRDMVMEMLTKHQNDWGLGPGLRNEGDSLLFGHGGKNAGFTNNMMAFVYQGDGAIVMTNGDRGGALMNEFLTAISQKFEWNIAQPRVIEIIDLPIETLKKLSGTWKYEGEVPGSDEYIMKLSVEGDKLVVYDPQDEITYYMSSMPDMKFIDLERNESLNFNCGTGCDEFFWNGQYRFIKQ
jgi:CubicO group peptidase (beta-lactamase class C family)